LTLVAGIVGLIEVASKKPERTSADGYAPPRPLFTTLPEPDADDVDDDEPANPFGEIARAAELQKEHSLDV
jgi:hypothetical protein